nr:MAG TPA: hypothetical protein [Caudoviricetes sp.]
MSIFMSIYILIYIRIIYTKYLMRKVFFRKKFRENRIIKIVSVVRKN